MSAEKTASIVFFITVPVQGGTASFGTFERKPQSGASTGEHARSVTGKNDLTAGWIISWVQHGARDVLRYPSKGLVYFLPGSRNIRPAGGIF